MTKQEALALLLALPDPPDLPRRGYRYTQTRDPRRDPNVIKRDLGTAYVERRRQERGNGGDISCVVSVRRQVKLRRVG
ncbi:MAG: hypothetical protein NUV51_09500 [Sulfuricaulis sp.]|nr:hypothetical protein [Sulfuricaulis sp.]